MSHILEQAETLRQQAIGILMAERQEIDRKLALLGADGNEPTPATPKPRVCARCGKPGHNAKTCKEEAPANGGESVTQLS
jgi:hypothetical protein